MRSERAIASPERIMRCHNTRLGYKDDETSFQSVSVPVETS